MQNWNRLLIQILPGRHILIGTIFTEDQLSDSETIHSDIFEDIDEATTKAGLVNFSLDELEVIDSETQSPIANANTELTLHINDQNDSELSETIFLTTPRSGTRAILNEGRDQPPDEPDDGSGFLDPDQSESITDLQFNFEEAFQDINLLPLKKGNESVAVRNEFSEKDS